MLYKLADEKENCNKLLSGNEIMNEYIFIHIDYDHDPEWVIKAFLIQ